MNFARVYLSFFYGFKHGRMNDFVPKINPGDSVVLCRRC